MARYKDTVWNLEDPPKVHADCSLAVLMDIRDELKELNAALNSPEFLDVPRVLRRIRANTYKPRAKKR